MDVRALASATTSSPLQIHRVLTCTFLVILFVVVLEAGLHKLGHAAKHHHKYHEMFSKTTGELMVVGLIYLMVKGLCYCGAIDYGGIDYGALDAADMLLFFVALFLVAQALVVFMRLRSSNKTMDSVTIATAGGLVEMAANAQPSSFDQLLERKVLATFFRDIYELPPVFSFAKYMREIQDGQIVALIEIDVMTWTLLLVLLAGFFACTGELIHNSVYYNKFPVGSKNYTETVKLQNNRAVVFGVFAAALTVSMALLLVYLKKLHRALVAHASKHALRKVDRSPTTNDPSSRAALVEAVQAIAIAEHDVPVVATKDAIDQMRSVSEAMQAGVHHRHKGWIKHNLLAQLVFSGCRKCCGRSRTPANTLHTRVDGLSMPLPFPRKLVLFLLQFFLLVNGLYAGMLVTCVVPTFEGKEAYVIFALVAPLLVNAIVLAPQLVRDFSLLNGTWKVEPATLARVIDHLSEVQQMKASMVHQIHAYLRAHNQTVDDIRAALDIIDQNDGDHDGYVEIDEFRTTLKGFGFKFSRHKFHTFVLLEYKTRGTTVKFDDLFLTLAGPADAADIAGSHYKGHCTP